MLWTTSAYFHTNPEKVAGYCESSQTQAAEPGSRDLRFLIVVGLGAVTVIHFISRSANLVAPNLFPRHS